MGLQFFYKREQPNSSGYLFVAEAQDYERFLDDKYEPLPSLSEAQAKNFLSRYNAVIQECLTLNQGNKFFKMTPFALRNTWQSSFYQGAESAARLETLKEGSVYFNSPEWFLWAVARWNVNVDAGDVSRAYSDLGNFYLRRFFMIWQGLRFCWSRRMPKKEIPAADVFLASIWTKNGLEQWATQGREPFYGDLPKRLNAKNFNAAIFYHAENLPENSDLLGPLPVFDLMAFLGLKEWICLIGALFTFSFKKPNNPDFPVAAMERDVATSLSNQVLLALVSYKVSRRLMIANEQARFVSLYENNSWEQGLLQAAKEQGRNILGFQHTAFAPAMLKMDNHIKDKMLPNKILTSGIEPASVLKKIMGHDPQKIEIGCSLRYQPVKAEASPGKKILILLQGAPDDALFLQMLSRHLNPQDVIVRVHPSWPLKNTAPFAVSANDLVTDLAQARIAMYTGTTAAFEAFSAYIPVIHVDLGQTLSADPLFTLENCSVKKIWKSDGDLKAVIAQIDALTPAERQSGFATAQNYIKNYFIPADNNAIDAMIGKILNDN